MGTHALNIFNRSIWKLDHYEIKIKNWNIWEENISGQWHFIPQFLCKMYECNFNTRLQLLRHVDWQKGEPRNVPEMSQKCPRNGPEMAQKWPRAEVGETQSYFLCSRVIKYVVRVQISWQKSDNFNFLDQKKLSKNCQKTYLRRFAFPSPVHLWLPEVATSWRTVAYFCC